MNGNLIEFRFQNTLVDLDDCYEALARLVNDRIGKLSESELEAAQKLVTKCIHIVELVSADICDPEEPIASILYILPTLSNSLLAHVNIISSESDSEPL